MTKVAICDDESYVVDKIEKYLCDYDKDESLDYQVFKYYDGESLVNADLIFDLVFLDIVMKDMDGIETGVYLKNRSMKTQIVYITNFSDYSLNAHSIHAFDYIVKPVEYTKLASILRDFKKLNEDTDAKENGISIDIQIDDVPIDFIDDFDITAIFANLLDNAIEACCENTGKKYIKMKIGRFNDFVVINMENSYNGLLNKHNMNYLSTKKDHDGVGLKSVRLSVEKYDGILITKHSDVVFVSEITIPMP